MRKIEWRDDFLIGIDEIDEQHRSLVAKLNGLIDKYQTEPDELRAVVDFLIDYVLMHFETEEKYMKKYGYPGLAEQIMEHREFTKELNKIVDQFMLEGPSDEIEQKIEKGLIRWVEHHIMNVDRKFGLWLKERSDIRGEDKA